MDFRPRCECGPHYGPISTSTAVFQQPFSWKALGLDVHGRSFTLRICNRTSHQIRAADRLLPGAIADVDGIAESRKGTVSVWTPLLT
jgi:hypothetical protein